MRIFYVDDNDQQRQLYTVYLENILDNIEVFHEANTDLALMKMKKIPNIVLVLCANLKDGRVGDVYDYTRAHLGQTPFMLIGPENPDSVTALRGFRSHNDKNGNIQLPISPVQFRETILNTLCPSRFSMAVIPAFKKVRLMHFYRFNKVHCNVYIKLSDRKYVKVINQNTVYSRADLDKLMEKDVEFLYIRNDDFDKFHVTFSKTPFLSNSNDGRSPEEVADILATTQAIMRKIIRNFGPTEEVIEMANKSVGEIMSLAENTDGLTELVDRMKKNMNYIYDHSYLVAIVCCDILKQMKWNSEEKVRELCMAALFHDITLSNPELAMIQDQSDIRLYHYTEEQIKEYLQHPFKAADILSKADFVTDEVIDIIRQHHENHEGQGFPNKLHPSRLSPLVCIFIMAHDFVSEIFKLDFDPNSKEGILERMLPKYKSGNFKQPMNAFLKGHCPELAMTTS